MGLFTRNGKHSRDFKSALGHARNDRAKLVAKLPQAEEQLAAALAERRSHLSVEAINDIRGISRDVVDAAEGRVKHPAVRVLPVKLPALPRPVGINYLEAPHGQPSNAAVHRLRSCVGKAHDERGDKSPVTGDAILPPSDSSRRPEVGACGGKPEYFQILAAESSFLYRLFTSRPV
jgi:hypothetical protein